MGIVGRMPFAGMAWQVMHYIGGFRRLGCDVYYVEDSSDWPYDPVQNAITEDCTYAVNYIAGMMDWLDMPGNWAYRPYDKSREPLGLSQSKLEDLYGGADAILNVCGATLLDGAALKVPARIYLETDPMLPQIEVTQGKAFTIDLLERHTHLFTYAENLGASDCTIPVGRFHYHTTRPPVVLDWWKTDAPNHEWDRSMFTTIANWRQSGKDIEWNGELYRWSKHTEFLKFVELPSQTAQNMGMALSSVSPEEKELLRKNGWHIDDAFAISKEILPYRDFISASRGEFTVGKSQYVRTRSGWFSDRSVCFLAAARPVITQQTGFDRFIPTGRGLFGFAGMEDVVLALEQINADYDRHSRAARDIAAAFFDAERVLRGILEATGI
jgi:hypothetical protein